MDRLRIGFITGSRSRLRAYGLAAKQRKMRWEAVVYPDVYSLPYFVADRFDWIRDGSRIRKGEYDLVFTELNRSETQMRNIASVIEAGHPVAVIPGPPELLASVLTDAKLELVKGILDGARNVLAYSEPVRAFCDGLASRPRAALIPWPFDRDAVRRIGGGDRRSDDGRVRVLLTVPMRFTGIAQTFPFVLKSVIQDVLRELEPAAAARFAFHTFAYTEDDRREFASSGYADGWAIELERKRGFRSFVRFLADCDATVNLTAGSVLGRITFLAAALGRPGVFSDNVALNRELYPGSTASLLDAVRLRELVRGLFLGLAGAAPLERFLPAAPAVAEIGDFASNSARFRALLGLAPAQAPPL